MYFKQGLDGPLCRIRNWSDSIQHSRDRYYQDGFFGHYFFTPFQNWNPSTGLGTTTKIFIDGVDESSNFTLVSKSYKRTDGAAFDGTITIQTTTQYNTVFDLVDLLFSPCNATKAPNSDDAVEAGIMINIQNKETSSLCWIR